MRSSSLSCLCSVCSGFASAPAVSGVQCPVCSVRCAVSGVPLALPVLGVDVECKHRFHTGRASGTQNTDPNPIQNHCPVVGPSSSQPLGWWLLSFDC